mmetsp:Transcript_53307/g.125313  ORF Transcript_53307/g.125313 Transcript_53307/m.125313 type:complete len:212 (-) Transcript_53307:768-1403(-)
MAVAGDADPVASTDLDLDAIHQTAIAGRHLGHHLGVVIGACADLVERLRVGQAMAAEEGCGRCAAHADRRAAGEARQVEVGRADPQPALPFLRQPLREAEVVRVKVRRHHAQHRQAVQAFGKHPLPVRPRVFAGDAAVDDGPALAAVDAVTQQPQVDMVQRKRQAHAHPAHAGRQVQRLAGAGQDVTQGIVEFGFAGVGHDAAGSLVRDLD